MEEGLSKEDLTGRDGMWEVWREKVVDEDGTEKETIYISFLQIVFSTI